MTVYREPKNHFKVGDLRTKTWRTLESNVAEDDARWRERCAQYWTLQSRLYGVVMSSFAMLVDNSIGCVSTYSTVLAIMPGERTLDYSRVPIGQAEVESVA